MSQVPTTGSLNEVITIRRQINVKNPSTGGLTRSWSTIDRTFARIIALNGREAVIANTLQGQSTFEVMVRYRTDLKAADQVLWGERELNIIAPPEDRYGDKRWTQIIASTAAPQGA